MSYKSENVSDRACGTSASRPDRRLGGHRCRVPWFALILVLSPSGWQLGPLGHRRAAARKPNGSASYVGAGQRAEPADSFGKPPEWRHSPSPTKSFPSAAVGGAVQSAPGCTGGQLLVADGLAVQSLPEEGKGPCRQNTPPPTGSPRCVLTWRQADLLHPYDVIERWSNREPSALHLDDPEHHLEELALVTVAAEWLTRW